MPIATVNPATGQTLRTFEPLASSQIEEKLQRAADTFPTQRRLPFAQRSRLMSRAAEILEANKDMYARLMTTEMGKTLRSAVEEVLKCARGCRYYADNAERLLAPEQVETEASLSLVLYQPLGPVLAVMPWNFPFWQVFRFAAPALMAGNVGLLKHASNVPQCALAIEDVFRQAGFPEGAFQTLLVGSAAVQGILDDPRVKAVTLTGSEAAGKSVAGEAGRQIKKSVLELGGSDPFIVMPSADLDRAVRVAVQARTINNGQSCIAAKRFLVAEPIADEFERRFVRGMEGLKVGDPMDETTDLGPLATDQIVRDLHDQVRKSVAAGARLLTGGQPLDQPGCYFAPTVLTNIPPGCPAYSEELFGPVASLFRVRDVDEAIRLANDVSFGLGSSVWTNDEAERTRFIDEIEAGMVFVNGMVASDPRLPFGGVKQSGYGRELSVYGIREFVNVKTVWIQEGPGAHRTRTE
jgi:succinate-semialdehyde dehydrogenase/glutarate-semialdehyde dehydrogenase